MNKTSVDMWCGKNLRHALELLQRDLSKITKDYLDQKVIEPFNDDQERMMDNFYDTATRIRLMINAYDPQGEVQPGKWMLEQGEGSQGADATELDADQTQPTASN